MGNKKDQKGDTRRWEGGPRHTCVETMGDNGRQWETMGDNGRQCATMGDNGRQWETIGSMGDKGRQGETRPWEDTPSNTGRQGETRPREGEHIIQNMQAHMWGDNWRQKGKTRRREGGHTIQHRHTCGETMENIGRQGIDKTSRRQTHHPKQAHMWRDNGGQVETVAGKADTPTNKKETRRETRGDKGRQDQGGHPKNALRTPGAGHCLENKKGDNVERRGDKMLGKADTPSNKGKQKGAQWEREGDKTLGKRKQEGVEWETRGDKTPRKADAPSNKGKQEGAQWETKGDKTLGKADAPSNKGKHEGSQWETRGDNTLGKADTPSNEGNQEGVRGKGETRASDIQQRETRRGTMGDKRRQDPRQGTPSNKGKLRRGTVGDQTLGKADTPSNKGNQEGVQWETSGDKRGTLGDKGRQDPRKGGHTIQQRESRRGTVQSQTRGDKTVGKADIPFNKRKQWETKGGQTHGKADTPGVQSQTRRDKPSNKGKQEGIQGETRGDKTLGKADTPSNTKAETLRMH